MRTSAPAVVRFPAIRGISRPPAPNAASCACRFRCLARFILERVTAGNPAKRVGRQTAQVSDSAAGGARLGPWEQGLKPALH
jgi:hypothetical protein